MFHRFFLESLRRKMTQNKPGDLLHWSQHFLPLHFVKTPSAMHVWLAEHLDRIRYERGSQINVLAPRGAAKSTLATFAHPLREAVEGREPYIWLVSDTMSQAHNHLDNIKMELMDNRTLAAAYPNCTGKGTVWRNGSVTLNNGVVIEAYGTGQRIRGRRRREHRPTLIVADDLQNDQHIISAEGREKSKNWFYGTLLKAGTGKTNVVHLATALHREAIAMELLQKSGWTNGVFKALQKLPNRIDLWDEWEALYTNIENVHCKKEAQAFYEVHREAMHDGADVLWAENETLYDLMRMRVESGRTAFEREKQNSPLDPERCEFPESYFDETIWYETLPKSVVFTVLSLDPSKGRSDAHGDYSAYVFAALDANGIIYVDADLAKRPLSETVSTGVELYKRFRPNVFGIETNQFQELLKDDFESAFQREGLPGVLIYPVLNSVNKKVRIRRLGSYLSQKRLKFKRSSTSVNILLNQLKEFPLSSHDDGPDALEMSVRMLVESRE